MTESSLRGRSVAVIGASSGIGLAVANRAAALGALVRAGARRDIPENLANGVVYRTVDLREERSIFAFFAEVSRIDDIVLAAADLAWGSLRELDAAAIRSILEVKIVGYLMAVKAALPHMTSSSTVTMLSGVAAVRPTDGGLAVSAANGGVEAAARALAYELAPIRVNCVSPGITDTPLWPQHGDERRDQFAAIAAELPTGAIASAQQQADAIIHVMTNRAITGTTLQVDSGACVA